MSTVENTVPITVTGDNIEVTDSLVDYVNTKLERPLGKLRSNGVIKDCTVHLIVNKNPKVENAHRIEVNLSMVGTTVHSGVESPNMYTSIDNVVERLSRKLIKYKERRLQGWHGGKSMSEDMFEALDSLEVESEEAAEDEFTDPEAPEVTKVRSFDLSNPISMEEAIFALDYVDHDFYVYRDDKSNEVNVVYKRNAGGIGLVEPEQ
eukprot:CAMPEP_0178920278 /NCGR_PEP_ID=MMETSP0786-20121207/14917_1 /TAXON_ID=186022 /ORGANISM="Thalassionema frauenfeldii, Strain CCMP 1798" /LENGTH=205 /DNA_ID=CAMNT_0020594329 /DNA_START=169 /DNA_END=786 /DNA_ORIENTATION=+